MTQVGGYHLADGEGSATWFLDTLMTVKAGGDETRGAFTLIDCRAPTGSGPPLHVHHDEDEGFYVLEGTLAVVCGEQRWQVEPGGFVMLPRDVPHAYLVTSDVSCRLLLMTSRAQFGRFIAEAGRPALSRALPTPSVPDIELLTVTAARYGNEILGPPLEKGADS